jgi:hypothetical protein
MGTVRFVTTLPSVISPVDAPNLEFGSRYVGTHLIANLVSERKLGIFFKIKEGENYDHRNT